MPFRKEKTGIPCLVSPQQDCPNYCPLHLFALARIDGFAKVLSEKTKREVDREEAVEILRSAPGGELAVNIAQITEALVARDLLVKCLKSADKGEKLGPHYG